MIVIVTTYRLWGGVVRRLLNTLQSLAYRGGGASVERKALIVRGEVIMV